MQVLFLQGSFQGLIGQYVGDFDAQQAIIRFRLDRSPPTWGIFPKSYFRFLPTEPPPQPHTWRSPTKVIRVPTRHADTILKFARDLDRYTPVTDSPKL